MTRNQFIASLMASALSFGAAQAATTVINTGGSSLAAPTYIAEFEAYTAAHPTIQFNYAAVGSGAGQKGFLNNDITQFEAPTVTSSTLVYTGTPAGAGAITGTQVDFGASDAPLVASQLTNPATGSYGSATSGSAVTGPVIQFPTLGVPITMAYSQLATPLKGTLELNDGQICGIFSGKLTKWSQVVSGAAATPITVVYRTDGSGTTYLFTQHLSAVCNKTNSNFPVLPVPVGNYFITTTSSGVTTQGALPTAPSNFVGEKGSAAVANEIGGTGNSGFIGYLSPDYTAIAPLSANTHANVLTANVVNGVNKVAYAPTVANVETGLVNPYSGTLNGVVITSTNGTPPATKAAAQNPLNWVPLVPITKSGYPIVGYTTIDLASCYANKTAGSALVALMYAQYYTASYVTIIKNNGFAPLANTGATKFTAGLLADFLSNSSGYNINIDNATLCAGKAGR